MRDLFIQYPWLTTVLALWALPWKGLALWTSARKKDTWWFVVLLVIHTLGVLDIIYLFFIAKQKFILPSQKKNKK